MSTNDPRTLSEPTRPLLTLEFHEHDITCVKAGDHIIGMVQRLRIEHTIDKPRAIEIDLVVYGEHGKQARDLLRAVPGVTVNVTAEYEEQPGQSPFVSADGMHDGKAMRLVVHHTPSADELEAIGKEMKEYGTVPSLFARDSLVHSILPPTRVPAEDNTSLFTVDRGAHLPTTIPAPPDDTPTRDTSGDED